MGQIGLVRFLGVGRPVGVGNDIVFSGFFCVVVLDKSRRARGISQLKIILI